MPLNAYCATVLARELASADYNGKTADEAWAWLMLPTARQPLSVPTGLKLTPVVFAGIVGANKANAVAAAIQQAYPLIASALMTEGIDPTKAESSAFLAGLVTGGVLTQADLDAVNAAAVRQVPQDPLPERFIERFLPERWPHVAPDGTAGGAESPSLTGFPNAITRDEFNAAWSAAGRN